MKNLKVLLSAIPLIIASLIIYFSTSAYNNEKPSGGLLVHLINATSLDCLDGDLTYCINGSGPIRIDGDFKIDVECNEYVEICVKSSAGCAGSWAGNINCAGSASIDIYLSNIGADCKCD